jgi:C2 domain
MESRRIHCSRTCALVSSRINIHCFFNRYLLSLSLLFFAAFAFISLDPVWTLRTGSLCLFKVNPQDLFLSDGLQCTVVDFDKMGGDEKLGEFYIPPHTIYEGKGERTEFKLLPPPKSKKDEVPGFVAIRVRRATEYDLRFMAEYHNKQDGGGIGGLHHNKHHHHLPHLHHPTALKDMLKTATETQGGGGVIASYFRRQTRTIKDATNPNAPPITQYKLRPGPDPKRVEETTWMTKQNIETESLHDSQHWLDSGTGRLGRIFLEVIGCDDLPNLDMGGRNKTDTFVSIVYEDSVVKTDVIDDCLNPRWMPWMRRAFIFHMFHTSSQIFLGAFDNDDSLNPADDHGMSSSTSSSTERKTLPLCTALGG